MAAVAEKIEQQIFQEQGSTPDWVIGEKRKSFDPLASVDMLRYDIENYGYVHPQTRERVCDEELSYLVEGIDRASRTTFALKRQGSDLVYFSEGEWKPYVGSLMNGLKVANHEAKLDPRRQFLADMASGDLINGYAMSSLQPGEKRFWYSSYNHQVAQLYGDKFMRERGFQADRKMGFLYQASCQEDGSVVLESQTVDQSDADALAAVDATIGFDPDTDLDALVRTYDGALMKKFDGYFFAGRRDAAIKENAWNSVLQQRDLIDYHLGKLENIAKLSVRRDQLENITKKHLYGVWATFKKRIDGNEEVNEQQFAQQPYMTNGILSMINQAAYHDIERAALEQEVKGNFQEFARQGRPMVGCGGSISMLLGENGILDASSSDVYDSIFGNSTKAEKYSFDKKMHCVVCQAPPKKGANKKPCGPCGLCRSCDKKAGGKG